MKTDEDAARAVRQRNDAKLVAVSASPAPSPSPAAAPLWSAPPGIDLDAAAELIGAAADVALVVDGRGVIRKVAVGSEEGAIEGCRKWVGQPWAETVTVESRPKVNALLRDAVGAVGAVGAAGAADTARKWRHINHPSPRGIDVPVLYSAIQVGSEGSVIAFGRDLRPAAALQQRLVDAQQSMERDYLRLRHMETRYRLLFQIASEPILVVDAATQKIIEANPAAGQVTGESVKRLVGRAFADCFEAGSRASVLALLGRVPAAGSAEEVRATLAGGDAPCTVSASLFRQENGNLFLVRLSPKPPEPAAAAAGGSQSLLLEVLESVPDAFVVTDAEGHILTANAAFVDMTQLAAPEQLQGESLDRWLGRSGVDLNVLIANLRQHGSVRLFATTVSGEYGSTAQVEISATSVPHGDPPCLGFTIRDVGRRLGVAEVRATKELPRSVAQLTELVGRVPLKDIVGETTDLIEQMCIQAALELTHDNRASAAEMLGLSRQSLYVKLRRYGIGDLGADAPAGER